MPTNDTTLSPHSHVLPHKALEQEGNDMGMFGGDASTAQNTDAHDARQFKSMTLPNGEVVSMPSASAAALEEPLHVANTGTPEKTTGYMRLIMAGSMARHAARALGEVFTGFDNISPWLDKIGVGELIDKIIPDRNRQLKIIDDFFEEALKQGISPEALAEQDKENYKKVFAVFRSAGKMDNTDALIADMYRGFKEAKEFIDPENVQKVLQEYHDAIYEKSLAEGVADAVRKVITDDTPLTVGHEKILRQEGMAARESRYNYRSTKDSLTSELKKNQFGHIFDAGLASIVTALTVKYGIDVYKDMDRSFAEAIAYEDKNYAMRKKPSEINMIDLFQSDNKIVQETCQNYVSKNVLRGIVCALFMGRFVSKALGDEQQWLAHLPFGDAMLGVMGMLMLGEVMRKDSSIFNDVIELIDNKLNPRRGMAAPINGSDLWDLCQKDFSNRHPEKMFQDATHNNHEDGEKWVSARAICDRMAEMMNHTYKYKNPNVSLDDPVAQVEQEIIERLSYFTVPKFIFLLGHDMIDFDNPVLSLACAEIANTYSVQAAKRFWHLVKDEQVSLKDALGDYVVDLSRTLGGGDPEIDEISARAPLYRKAMIENFLQDSPAIHEKYDALQEIKEQMQQQGNTVLLRDQANAVIKDIRVLMDERTQQNEAEIASHASSVTMMEKPETAVSSVVPYQRMMATAPAHAHSLI